MSYPIFTGAATALVTPFTDEGVDYPALERLIEFQIENACDALVVCGTTGEAATMTYEERVSVIAFTVKRVRSRIPVIAGTGANSTANAIRLSLDAENCGADALLVVTPFYNKATQKGLIRHFTAIADAVKTPIILYNVPSRTGVDISSDTYAALTKHMRITGVKEASGDIRLAAEIMRRCGELFTVWSGNDADTLPIMALGGAGIISVAANIVPYEMHRLSKACLRGDLAEARMLNARLLPLMDALSSEVNPIPVKTAMNLLGMDAGRLRLPLCEMEKENFEKLRTALEDYGLLAE
ncbi:MAG: 4-hydroxy-tetrahydrodipicolinate synthase [Oscillospiraceae bacterium]|nr:4-hydroxy-tetrahydrodipicolinate synthase [Oscillospiraceae bacterium]